ncbi:hypothetical protein [Anaerobiospirillum sp. NML120448]|nr:hypothetical protein [Anaerobiospirillum sp. NML120448]
MSGTSKSYDKFHTKNLMIKGHFISKQNARSVQSGPFTATSNQTS